MERREREEGSKEGDREVRESGGERKRKHERGSGFLQLL